MALRDILIFAIVLIGLPLILKRPSIGVLYWVWISLMNPHREAWGFAYSFPFAMVIAAATFIGMAFTREPRTLKGGLPALLLLAFVVWTCVTTSTALVPSSATVMLERVLKIQLFTFIALIVLYKREHVVALMWVVAVSIGYFGVKGGLFTVMTGGNFRVWGPAESFISDNNALALAVVMSIPLWAYLWVLHRGRWVRIAIAGAIACSAVAVLGSHSRGALLAICAMAAFLWLKGRQKVVLGAVLVMAALAMVAFMPEHWETRMRSIGEYKEDDSAQSRIKTWTMLYNLAVDRPAVGGGFEPYTREVFQTYLPGYPNIHSAHSIYFQVLGEHGFIGLTLFLLFWLFVWLMASSIVSSTKGRPDDQWAFWLARMVQVSLIAYFVGGVFLNLAYWDMPYYLFVAVAVTRYVLRRQVAEQPSVPKGSATPARQHA